jgi:hypothetical protein
MAPIQIPKNFKFEPLYPFPLPLQDEVGPSSSSPPTFDDSLPSFSQNHLLKIYPSKVVRQKGYFMRFPQSFRMHGLHLPWVDFVINDKGEEHQVRCMIYIDL